MCLQYRDVGISSLALVVDSECHNIGKGGFREADFDFDFILALFNDSDDSGVIQRQRISSFVSTANYLETSSSFLQNYHKINNHLKAPHPMTEK